jgi:glycosyltransferase involved in cell wall biosynthesis
MKPLISIVLPVYNGARYIESSLRSILTQDEDCEIIVSDDCSSDDTIEIVRSIASSRVKLIVNERNGGQFINFNRALRAASGNFIQLFSHDDLARPGFLKSQAEAFETKPGIGLVYASCNIIDEGGRLIAAADDEGTPSVIDFNTYLAISSRYGSLPASVSCVMVTRKTLEHAGLFDERFDVAGDLEFYNRVAERFLLARNRKLLVDIRVHGGSVSFNSSTPIKFMREEIEILPFYRRHLGERKYGAMIRQRVRSRGAYHGKYMIRAGLRGELARFVEAYRTLSRVHNVPLCLIFALIDGLRNIAAYQFRQTQRFFRETRGMAN